MEVARTILSQLGGNKFMAMTGAKNLVGSEDALCMHLPRNKSGAKYLRIEITMSDTYNVIFRKHGKNYTFPIAAKFENVYAEMLQKIFTEVTGFDTKL
jgi:hypothetical protein